MKKLSNIWVVNQTWSKIFITSHIFGWTVAFLQTIWIVYEIRKAIKK